MSPVTGLCLFLDEFPWRKYLSRHSVSHSFPIEFLARLKRLFDNEGGICRMLLDIAFRNHHDIFSETKTPQVAVYVLSSLSTVAAIGHDDQSIQIAIWSHLSMGGRTK